jgi:hypothetical protein
MEAARPAEHQSGAATRGSPQALMSVRGLGIRFQTSQGEWQATRKIDFDIASGERVGIVGESGCGKTITGLSILRLLPNNLARLDGSIMLDDIDLASCSTRAMRAIRGRRIAMIFQEPMSALDPVFTVGHQIAETLRVHTDIGRQEARAQTIEMLRRVDIALPERLCEIAGMIEAISLQFGANYRGFGKCCLGHNLGRDVIHRRIGDLVDEADVFIFAGCHARDNLPPRDFRIDNGLASAPSVIDHHNEILHGARFARAYTVAGRKQVFRKIRSQSSPKIRKIRIMDSISKAAPGGRRESLGARSFRRLHFSRGSPACALAPLRARPAAFVRSRSI